jgi:glycosyltransferase involved in cell wall biosynthesis
MNGSAAAPLTVVIPTFNRSAILRKALEGYLLQSSPHLINEILVIDDGSTDDTQAVVRELERSASFSIRYEYQHNQGPAAARNLGLSRAQSWLVLYTDDDIIPHPNLVDEHVEWHRENPRESVAILGFVTWPREPSPTPFMRWYGEAGPLFAYKRLRHKREADYRYFYTCNLSVKRTFLEAFGRFDEHFKMAAYEDIELGFRLDKLGLSLLYNSQAIGYHHQFFTFADACRKRARAETARQTFLGTEAGKHFLRLKEQQASGFAFRISKLLATCFAKSVFFPGRLLDSRLPLPGVVYHSLLWYHGQKAIEVKEQTAMFSDD